MRRNSKNYLKLLLLILCTVIGVMKIVWISIPSPTTSQAKAFDVKPIISTDVEFITASYYETEEETSTIETTTEYCDETVYEVTYESVEMTETTPEEKPFVIPIYKMVWDGYEVHLREELQIHVYNLCVQYGIEWFYEYYLAQLFQESAWKEGIITPKGDYGIAQINIRNHAQLSSILGIYDFADSFNSISAGMYIMQGYLNKGYTVRQAMTAYRWGEANAMSPDPEGYYDRISNFTTGLCRIN